MERSEIADYCESDIANTYRVWLRHELFQDRLTNSAFEASEKNLDESIGARSKIACKIADHPISLSHDAAQKPIILVYGRRCAKIPS
jgi:hypothetical protein